MDTPDSSAPSSPYDASTPASAATPSDGDTFAPAASTSLTSAIPIPALTTQLTPATRRFQGFLNKATSTPGVGRLRNYAFPVYDAESRRWFLLRVVDVNGAAAEDIDSGDDSKLEGIYGALAEAVDSATLEAPPPAPIAGGGGEGESEAGEEGTSGAAAVAGAVVDAVVGAVAASAQVISSALSTTITNKTTSITVSLTSNTITATSSDPKEDITPGTYYATLEAYNLAKAPKKAPKPAEDGTPAEAQDVAPKGKERSPVTPVSRYGLLEVSRLAPLVDLVAPVWNPAERLVFKHYESGPEGPASAWRAVQFPLHLASQCKGIVPVKNLVTHERTRDARSGRVVGFTVPYYEGGSLSTSRRERTFKLKWAKDLFALVDELNLKFGVVHGGIKSGRVFVDEAEEKLLLGSFDQAKKRVPGGGKGATTSPTTAGFEEFNDLYHDEDELGGAAGDSSEAKLETDVIAAILLVHDLVTRDPDDDKWATKHSYLFSGIGLDTIRNGPWKAHPKAVLDAKAEEYRAAVVEWLDTRQKDPRVKEEAKDLGFEEDMPVPEADKVDVDEYEDPLGGEKTATKVAVSGSNFYRRDAIQHGKPVVDWVRPVTGQVKEGRSLLATGQYAKTEEERRKTNLKRRREGDERGRGSKRTRGGRDGSRGGRDGGRGERRPRHGDHGDGEGWGGRWDGRVEGRGRGGREHTLGNYRVSKPGDGEGPRRGDGPRPPTRGRRPGRGGDARGPGDRSREGTGERSGSNDSRRRDGRRRDGGTGDKSDGRGHGQGEGNTASHGTQ